MTYCLFTYLANCFAFICVAEVSPTALERFATPYKKQIQRVQFCMHVVGMHMHRLAQVWNAIITTKYYDVMQVDTTSHEYRYRYGRSDG